MRRSRLLLALLLLVSLAPGQELVWEQVGVPGVRGFGVNRATVSGTIANLGDLNGDSRDDLLLLGEDVPRHESKLFFLSGADGRILRSRAQFLFNRPYWAIAAAGDVDGDGTPDYATMIPWRR